MVGGGVTSLSLRFLCPVEKNQTDTVGGSATACWHTQLLAQI